MEELYMNIRKLVYERLDTGRDIDDAELYQVIDACIYEESRNAESRGYGACKNYTVHLEPFSNTL